MDVTAFVLSQLPPPPARVRVHGRCGVDEGALGAAGYVLAEAADVDVLERWGEPAAPRVVVDVPVRARLDDATADWLRGQSRVLAAATGAAVAADLEDAVENAEPVLAELRGRYEERVCEWAPVLYKRLGPAAYELERPLIDVGAIQAVGLRWVGERT